MMGSAIIGGDIRYTMDSTILLSGIGVIPALIGLFCVPVLIDLVASKEEHLRIEGKVSSYRLREAGRVILSLYRGKKRIGRLSAGNRRGNRAYRVKVSSRRLRKGATYRVRIFVRSADGTHVQRARVSAKRL